MILKRGGEAGLGRWFSTESLVMQDSIYMPVMPVYRIVLPPVMPA
jgi:hypothetical protein